MHAIRARHAYDGESFLSAGATVVVEDGLITGVESYGFQVPGECPVTSHEGTLLPGLIDVHAHLVADSGTSALDRVAGYSAEEIEQVHLPNVARSAVGGSDYRPRPGGPAILCPRPPGPAAVHPRDRADDRRLGTAHDK